MFSVLLHLCPHRYASLYFCVGLDDQDNELLTLEVLHRYVELLDKYFGNVRTYFNEYLCLFSKFGCWHTACGIVSSFPWVLVTQMCVTFAGYSLCSPVLHLPLPVSSYSFCNVSFLPVCACVLSCTSAVFLLNVSPSFALAFVLFISVLSLCLLLGLWTGYHL